MVSEICFPEKILEMEKNPEQTDRIKCPRWKEKTLMERSLILVCIGFFVTLLILIGLLIHFQNSRLFHKSSKEMVCLTPTCKFIAGRILGKMDSSVQPCDDFYNFSCGSYYKYKTVYKERMDLHSDLEGYFILLHKKLLEKPENQNEPRFASKVRKYYQSCLKEPPSVKEILEDFLNFTKFNDWPVSKDFNTSFEDTMAKFTLYSMDEGFLFGLYSNYKDNYLEYIGITYKSTSISEHALLNTTEEKSIRLKHQYLDLFRYVFHKIDMKDENAKHYTEEIIQLETSLASITNREYNETYTKKTVSEMEKECPQIKWTTLMRNVYEHLNSLSNYSDNLILNIDEMDYMMELCEFIGRNDRRIIHNLIVWNSFAKYLYRIDSMFTQLVNTLGSDSNLIFDEINPLKGKPRWEYCISNFEMPQAFGLNYMQLKAVDYADKIKKVKDYAMQISSTAKEIFSKQTWFDDYSKNITELMINNIDHVIGYYNSSLYEEKMNAMFDKINASDSYLYNILQAKKYILRDFLFNGILNELLFQGKLFPSFEANADFMGGHLSGRITIPLGIMFPPFYFERAPNYINYGGVGSVIAHEISHNFDDLDQNERPQDKANNETISWPKEFLEEYTRRRLCLINQYSKFIIEGNATIDGNFTIGDNFADNSGIIQAYWAYDKHLKKYGNEPKLPGFDFTNRQMFFIGYAQTKCEILQSLKEYEGDAHSPGKYRLLAPLMNFPEFSKIFNCPLNSYMNPVEKCKLWD